MTNKSPSIHPFKGAHATPLTGIHKQQPQFHPRGNAKPTPINSGTGGDIAQAEDILRLLANGDLYDKNGNKILVEGDCISTAENALLTSYKALEAANTAVNNVSASVKLVNQLQDKITQLQQNYDKYRKSISLAEQVFKIIKKVPLASFVNHKEAFWEDDFVTGQQNGSGITFTAKEGVMSFYWYGGADVGGSGGGPWWNYYVVGGGWSAFGVAISIKGLALYFVNPAKNGDMIPEVICMYVTPNELANSVIIED